MRNGKNRMILNFVTLLAVLLVAACGSDNQDSGPDAKIPDLGISADVASDDDGQSGNDAGPTEPSLDTR